MKKITKNLLPLVVLVSLLTIISCGEDNTEILVMEDDIYDARINNFATDSLTAEVFLSDVTDGSVDVLLSFTSQNDMRRLYITKNVQGQGDLKVDAKDEFGVNDKGDGSIDLAASAKNGFAFALSFSTTSLPDAGTVVYKFWATENKGDFRDSSKDLVEGVATLTINLSGSNPATAVRVYENVVLEAPLADGSSETFMSTLDGEIFTIDQGEEFASFWDLGYYYGASGLASLASTDNYPSSVIDVEAIGGTTDLNNLYLQISSKTTAEFDAITNSSELSSITQSTTERLNQLSVGNVIEFVDEYGKKGLIKVVEIQGTNGTGDFIKIDIKVQP